MASATKYPNPIGLDGLEFVEYCSPNPKDLEKLFEKFGLKKVGVHKRKKVTLYRQNRVNFVINEEPGTFAAQFAKEHGPSICATGFRVKNADAALKEVVARGAKPIDSRNDQSSHSFPAMYGIGDSAIYFVDRYQNGKHYDDDFNYVSQDLYPKGYGFELVDHLTNNVPAGDMEKWCDFYRNIFGFREVRRFDIRGQKTGLASKVMRSPCDKIIIPINEPTDTKSQIQEYLEEYKGSGIQHLALLTNDIMKSLERVRENGVQFLDAPPETYYEMIPERLTDVTEPIPRLQELGILVDGDKEGYLLQIFSQNQIGPIFFELIQRKGHDGFGEGNFQALFDSIERDQKRRGYLK